MQPENQPNNMGEPTAPPSYDTPPPTTDSLPMAPATPQPIDQQPMDQSFPVAPQNTFPVQQSPQPQPQFQPQQPSFPVGQPMPVSSPVAQPAKKKSKLWLWITLSIVGLLIIGAVITALVSKSNADTAAKNYRSAAKTYLGEVYDSAIGSSSKPSDILNDIKAVKAPELQDVFLSSLSGSYAEAEKLHDDITVSVAKLEQGMNGYVGVYDIYQSATDFANSLTNALHSSSQGAASIDMVLTVYQKYLDVVKNVTVPSELESAKSTLQTDLGTCVNNLSSMKTAYNNGDQAAYVSAFSTYSSCMTNDTINAANDIDNYYDNLASKVKTSAKPIQDLEDQIK